MKRFSLSPHRQICRMIVCMLSVICPRNRLLPNNFFEHETRLASRLWFQLMCLNWAVQSWFFVDPGTKINDAYYRDSLLRQKLLPAIRRVSGKNFIFQQDSAPAHRARETLQLLRRETPDFISPDLWPPNSPDLNPVDYEIWL